MTTKKNRSEEVVPVVAGKVDALKLSITAGIDAWREAGRLVVEMLDVDKVSLAEIAAAAEEEFLTVEVLAQFERIGRRQVMPALLAANYPAAKHIERFPYSEQERLMRAEAVELLVLRDDQADTLRVRTRDLTPAQCRQVFTKSGLRSLGAQRVYLEDAREKKAVSKKSAGSVPWAIRGQKVCFREGCELNRHDLAIILAQMS